MMYNANKAFFDGIRGHFRGGKLREGQVQGMIRIIEYGKKWGYSIEHLAYILATAKWETGEWMEPIREGALRFGPDYTNQQAVNAVTSIYNKGIIRTNYALPVGPYGKNYYGRGLVQITWIDNYKKFQDILGAPLVQYPDLTLEWGHALDIMFLGMREGLFTGKKLGDYELPDKYYYARDIVNGDKRKNGAKIAESARWFLQALSASVTALSAEGSEYTQPAETPASEPEIRRPGRFWAWLTGTEEKE